MPEAYVIAYNAQEINHLAGKKGSSGVPADDPREFGELVIFSLAVMLIGTM